MYFEEYYGPLLLTIKSEKYGKILYEVVDKSTGIIHFTGTNLVHKELEQVRKLCRNITSIRCMW